MSTRLVGDDIQPQGPPAVTRQAQLGESDGIGIENQHERVAGEGNNDLSSMAEAPMPSSLRYRVPGILIPLGIMVALERRSETQLLPFHLVPIGGMLPLECLLWSIGIVYIMVWDIAHSMRIFL